METFNYFYDKNGKRTGLLVDLTNPNIEELFKNPLNQAQRDLIQMVSVLKNEQHLEELRQILIDFLTKKILDEGDNIWVDKNYSKETFHQFVETD